MTDSITRDPLTGVFTRKVFEEMVKIEIEKFKRYGAKFSLLLLDLDHFKEVNDVLGHKTGDQVLIQIVEQLKAILRESDVIARWGGDEFIVLLPYTDEKSAMRVAKRIIEKLKLRVQDIVVGASCAFITPNPSLELTYEKMFSILDELLYRAKRQGRGRIGNMLDVKDRIVIPPFDFVSRETEYSLLRKYVLSQKVPMVIVSGETGIGKSRLVEEFVKREKLSFIETRAFGPVSGIPLFSIKNLLISLYRKDKEKFNRVVDKFNEEEKDIIGVFIPSLYRRPVLEDGYKSFFLVKLAEIISRIMLNYGFNILWVDDLQWVSQESFEVLRNIIAEGKVRIIATLRKEEREVADSFLNSSRINIKEVNIEGLDREGTEKLLFSLLGEESEKTLVDYVYRYSGGNPFYIEEIVSFLAQKGYLREQDGRIFLDRITEEVPSSLGDIISYKLRNFKEEEKHALWFVAVYHNPVRKKLLDDVLGKPYDEIEKSLNKALQAGIIAEKGDAVYFSVEAIRRIIVEQIPRGTYRQYHRISGELKEKEYKKKNLEPFELYDHFKETGDKRKTGLWALECGKEAFKRFSPDKAFEYYKEAFFSLDDSALRRKALLGMIKSGRVAGKIKDTTEVIENYGKEFLEDYLYEFYLGSMYVNSGKTEQALRLLKNAIEKAPDDEFRGECMYEIAWVYRKQGQLRKCIEELEKILNMNVSLRLHTIVMTLYGGVLMEYGDVHRAENILKTVIEEGEKTHTEYRITSAYINYALLKASTGDYQVAERYYKKAVEISEKSGERGKLLIALNNLGTLYLSQEKVEDAEKYYMRALDIAMETGNNSLEVIVLNNLGSTARERGLYKEACNFYYKTLEKARECGYTEWVSHSISNILLTYSNYDETLKVNSSLARELEDILNKLDVPGEKAYAYLALIDYFRKTGNFEIARGYISEYKKLPKFTREQYVVNFAVSMARYYDATGNLKMSDYYIKKIENIADKTDDMTTKSSLYKNIGDWYYEHGRLRKAKSIYRKALKFSRWLSEKSYKQLKDRMEELNESG